MSECERCGDTPPTERLQRTLDGVEVGSPIDVCSNCSGDFEGVGA